MFFDDAPHTSMIACVAEGLCAGVPSLMRHVSVGPYTPAVRTDATPAFCVLNLQGSPLAFAHDAFEAADLAFDLNADSDLRALRLESPLTLPTDAEAAEADLAAKRKNWTWVVSGLWVDSFRADKAAGRPRRY